VEHTKLVYPNGQCREIRSTGFKPEIVGRRWVTAQLVLSPGADRRAD
jgi:hypothetical protein